MKINTAINSNNSTSLTFGNRKIPRFLYHLTTAENYQSMLKDEKIQANGGLVDPIKGVFMVELDNLLKRWKILKESDGADVRARLLVHVAKSLDATKIVALRMATQNIDKSKLIIRSQNLLFSAHKMKDFDKCFYDWYASKKIPDGELRHIFEGDKAHKSRLYKQKGKTIEYIYPEDIAISKFEKIGEMDFDMTKRLSIKKTFKKLFKNQQEEKAFVSWKD